MAKKAVISLKGSDITVNGVYKFLEQYETWKQKCSSISSKRMMSEGRKIRKPRENKKVGQVDTKSGQAHPDNLYLQLEQHVTSSYRRDNSPNKGSTGTFKLLADIDEFMKDFKDIGVMTEEHRIDLEKFQKEIDDFNKPNGTLNPRNITFKSPKKYDSKGKNLGTKEDTEVLYGHFANDWFSKKYPKAKKAPKEWYSSSKNTANPPLAQALFGRGNLVKIGLKDVIDIAVAELDKAIESIELLVRRPSQLSRFKSIRKHVFGLLNNKDMFSKGGRPNLNKMAASFTGLRFTIEGTNKDGKKYSSEKRSLAYVANLNIVPSGDIKYFTLKPFQQQAMSSLIVAVVGKGKSKKLRWGEYLNLKGLKVPEEAEDNVKKSWIEYLWS